jgi:hypothetical protein
MLMPKYAWKREADSLFIPILTSVTHSLQKKKKNTSARKDSSGKGIKVVNLNLRVVSVLEKQQVRALGLEGVLLTREDD